MALRWGQVCASVPRMSRSSAAVRVLPCVAGLFVGAAAGFVIADPASQFAVSRFEPDLFSWDGWALPFTAAPGIAVVAAALTAMVLTRARQAWIVAAAAFAGLLIASGLVLDQVIPQLAQRYSVVGLAGVALGAAAVALWPGAGAGAGGSAPRRGGVVCLPIGTVMGLLLSTALVETVAYQSIPRRFAAYLDEGFALSSWWWIPAVAALLALAAAVVGADHAVADAPDRRTISAAVVVAVGGTVSYALADSDSFSVGRALVALLLALAVFAAAAWLLPGRDGLFLLAVLAISASTAPLAPELSASVILNVPVLAAAAALIGAGGYLGWRFPLPTLGLAGLLAVAALGIPEVGDPTTLNVIRLLISALAAGHLLASTLPDRAATGALGVAALFTPFAWSAMSALFTPFGWVSYTPLSDATPDGGRSGDGGLSTGGAFLSNDEFPFHALTPSGVSAAMALLVLAAGAGMIVLSHSRASAA